MNLKWKPLDTSTWHVITGGEIKLAEYNQSTKEMHIIFVYNGNGLLNGSTFFTVPNAYSPVSNFLGLILYTFEKIEKSQFYVSGVQMRNTNEVYSLYVGAGETYNHRMDIRYTVL